MDAVLGLFGLVGGGFLFLVGAMVMFFQGFLLNRIIERIRSRHVTYWFQQGQPWHRYLGPTPYRNEVERDLAEELPRTQPSPSFKWVWRLSLELPEELSADAALRASWGTWRYALWWGLGLVIPGFVLMVGGIQLLAALEG